MSTQIQQKSRILLVDDNKTLSKLIQLKLENELKIAVDVAYNAAEAELFSRKYRYRLAIVDLNLPDAPNGEIVDRFLEKKIPTIVLTGNIDKELRGSLLKKDIIDYVFKGGIQDIDYIVSVVERLIKNRKHKVMIVDDSALVRNELKRMLNNLFFEVYALAHGEEAMMILEQHPDIRVVVTDYYMPVMDGLELTKEIRKKFTKNDLTIFVLSSADNPEISALFLKSGANDFIHKPFSKEEFTCRINNAIEALENIDTITNMASRDFLTGLYNRRYFFSVIESYFSAAISSGENFVIAMIDIDHFKKINDTYGHDIGDKVIVHFSEILRSNVQAQDMVARFGGEEFCVVLKNIDQHQAINVLERIRHLASSFPLIHENDSVSFTVSIGAALESENTLNDTINEADGKLYQAKNSGRNQLVY